MIAIDDLVKDLKGKECQWLINNTEVFIRFEAKLKEIDEIKGMDHLLVRCAGKNSMSLTVSNPFECIKNEDENKVVYSLLRNDKTVVKVGYFK